MPQEAKGREPRVAWALGVGEVEQQLAGMRARRQEATEQAGGETVVERAGKGDGDRRTPVARTNAWWGVAHWRHRCWIAG